MISQQVKFESSPANSISHSFPSTPGNDQVWDSPLLPTNDSFTPGSFDDEYDEESLNGTPPPEPESEKKPAVKKRKSWGQQLPEPKTNLPPRKRAKTEDEKEQRRVERVLRNRRAAQTSRERKRLEVEGLEKAKQDVEQRNRHLERRLQELEARNQQLEQLVASGGGDLSVYRQPANTNNFNAVPLRCSTPITFTPELFPARDSHRHNSPCSTLYSVHSSPPQQRVDTVNPASLSPEMRPVDESMNSFSDMTQHPAAVLCDLQCQSETRSWTSSGNKSLAATACLRMIILHLLATTWVFTTPLTRVRHSLKTGSTITPVSSLLNMILCLVALTSTSTCPTRKTLAECLTVGLRIRMLKSLLACSPQLARPLLDATLGAMRSVSNQQCVHDGLVDGRAGNSCRTATLFKFITMAHAINMIMLGREPKRKPTATTPEGGTCNELTKKDEISLVVVVVVVVDHHPGVKVESSSADGGSNDRLLLAGEKPLAAAEKGGGNKGRFGSHYYHHHHHHHHR